VSGPDLAHVGAYLAVLLACAWPLGAYMARVYQNRSLPSTPS